MTSWVAAVPAGLASLAVLLVPGLLVGYALGLRSLAAWAMAPVVTVALVATAAVLAAMVGIGWSPALVVGVAVVVSVVVGVPAFLLRQRWRAVDADPRAVTVAAAVGLVAAALLGGLTMVLGLRRPDQLSQTYDAVFHYNAVAWVLDSGDGSSLTMNGLGTPGLAGSFYPAAWHDLVSLVVRTSGGSIPVSTNMVSLVVAVVVWPLSCLLLARQVFGRSRAALVVTGLLSVAFAAFPWGMLGFGVLWPNLLAMAIAPAGLAVVVSICGLARDDAIGRGRAWLLLPVVLVAEALAQTNVVFTLVLFSLFPVGTVLARRAVRFVREGRAGRAAVEPVVAVAVVGGGWWWAATTPAFAAVRTQYWAPFESTAQAGGEVVLNATHGPIATDGFHALWVLSAVLLVGLVLACRRPELRWLVGGYVLTAGLFVLTAAVNRPDTQKFTGYWYNDAYRIGAMLPIVAVPIATAAVLFLARRAQAALAARSRIVAPAGLVVLVMVLLGVFTQGLYLGDHVATLAYRRAGALEGTNRGEGWLVDAREAAFFARVAPLIPADAVVAGNPWDGSGLLWALADRRTLFPHVGMATTPAQLYLAAHLVDATTDPAVCAAAAQLHVEFLLIGNGRFWLYDDRVRDYPGFADPGARPGFQLADSDGPMKLYRLTACSSAMPVSSQ